VRSRASCFLELCQHSLLVLGVDPCGIFRSGQRAGVREYYALFLERGILIKNTSRTPEISLVHMISSSRDEHWSVLARSLGFTNLSYSNQR